MAFRSTDLEHNMLLDLAKLAEAATGARSVTFQNAAPEETSPFLVPVPAGAAGFLVACFDGSLPPAEARGLLLAAAQSAAERCRSALETEILFAITRGHSLPQTLALIRRAIEACCPKTRAVISLNKFSSAEHAERTSDEVFWTTPLIAADRSVLGTLEIYCAASRKPTQAELEDLRRLSALAVLAISSQQTPEERLREVPAPAEQGGDGDMTLGASEADLRSVLENAPAVIITVDSDLRITYSTRQLQSWSQDNLVGQSVLDFTRPESRNELEQAIREAISNGMTRTVEVEVEPGSAERVWFAITIGSVNVNGTTTGAVLSAIDITERKKAEEEAMLLRERVEMAVRGSTASLWDYDLRTRQEVYSQRFYEMLELPPEDIPRSVDVWESRIHPEDRAYVLGAFRRHLQEGTVYDVEYRLLTAKGQYRWFNTRGQALRDRAGVAYRMAGSTIDITERKMAEEAVRQSEERYRLLFYASPQPMFVFDPKTQRLLAMNDAACTLYGATRRDLRQDPNWVAEHRQKGRQRRRDGQMLEVEYKEHEIEFADQPALLALVTDRTRQVQLEKQLLQSQKMDAFGQLAGGVAHDFNNLLTVINGYGKLGLRKLDESSPARRDLELVLSAGERAMGLTRQLLAFARRQVIQPQQVSVQQLLDRSITILRPLLGEQIRLVLNCPDIGSVMADPGQLEQVLINLAVNARDAMPAGGTLSISAALIEREENAPGYPAEMPAGRYARIQVQDSGKGMAKEELQHIFEPFFTTKPVGKGTGLGLSTVYGIVSQAEGHIVVDSEPGQGARFSIYLPSTGPSPVPSLPECEARSAVPTGRETILLVEDEEGVRGFATVVLEAAGYKVLQAQNGAEALHLYTREGESVQLVLTDLIMPLMTGFELARQLRAIKPCMPITFMSGYTSDVSEIGSLPGAPVTILQKPFQEESLRNHVRHVLDQLSHST